MGTSPITDVILNLNIGEESEIYIYNNTKHFFFI